MRCRETLYNWYGSKQRLFHSLVEENAREVAGLLRDRSRAGRDPLTTLKRLGPLLLRLLVSERAVALNRAAVADVKETGLLGRTLGEADRNSVVPLIANVFEEARSAGQLSFEGTDEAVDVYIGLLVGDLQIRRAICVRPLLGDEEIKRRADRAFRCVQAIFGGRDGRQAPRPEIV